MKYILWAAANNKDIFDDNYNPEIKEEENADISTNQDEFPNIIKSLKLSDH